MLGYKTKGLNKFKRSKIRETVFSDHKEIKKSITKGIRKIHRYVQIKQYTTKESMGQ